MGRDFDLRVLQEVADADAEQLLEALEEAQAARVIAPLGAPYRFAHVLISDALVDGLSASRRLGCTGGLARRSSGPMPGDSSTAWESSRIISWRRRPQGISSGACGTRRPPPSTRVAAWRTRRRLGCTSAHSARLTSFPRRRQAVRPADRARRSPPSRRCPPARQGYVPTSRGARPRAGLGGAARARGPWLRRPRGSFGVVDQELVSLLEEALAVLGRRRDGCARGCLPGWRWSCTSAAPRSGARLG